MTAFLQGVCVIFQQIVSICISIIMIMTERLCGRFQWITYAPTQLLTRMHVDGCTMFQRIVTGQWCLWVKTGCSAPPSTSPREATSCPSCPVWKLDFFPMGSWTHPCGHNAVKVNFESGFRWGPSVIFSQRWGLLLKLMM